MPSSKAQFWESLLELDDQLEVKPLKDRDVWKAANTWTVAFFHDPLINYMKENKPDSPRAITAQKIVQSGILLGWIRVHDKVAITVKDGLSLVVATLPPSSVGRTRPKDKLIKWLINWTLKYASRLGRREKKKRVEEIKRKVGDVISEKIGDRKKDMMLVDLVCTDPESQGHGYASALLDTITRLADILGVACWLESSNIINEPFYNSHGFKTVGEAMIGDDNPTYHEKPFPVQIMVREPVAGANTGTNSASTEGSLLL